MKKYLLTPTLLAVAALISACGSVPKNTSLLDQTRSDYVQAQNNPDVAKYAPLEMQQAGTALAQANAAADDRTSLEKIDNLAYIAKQKIALTQEVAKKKSAEADIANSAKERDQMRLDQRTNEANIANLNAEKARVSAAVAQSEAALAQRQTQEALARTAQLEAQLAVQLADMAAKKTERGMVITLGDVLFGTDQAHLSADGVRTAQKLATVLQQNPQRSVLIEGFTDSTGSDAYNMALSQRRATTVRGALTDLGVAADRIDMQAYGETHPVAANDSASNRQLNRRVEIVLSNGSDRVIAR